MAGKPTKAAGAKRAAAPAPSAGPAAPFLPGRAQPRLQGSLDRVDPDGTLEGWCWSPDEPNAHRAVAVLIDAVEAARFMSDQPRSDLIAGGIGNGRHAFRFRLDPGVMLPGQRVAVTLRDVRSGQQIGGAVQVQWPDAAEPESAAVPVLLPTLYGYLDRVSRDGMVSGWCWYPDKPDVHVDLAVLVDDEHVGTTRADAFRPDLQQAGIGDGSHGFAYALPYAVLAEKGTLRVAVQEAGSGRNLFDPVTVRLGRVAAAEDRIIELERQVRLLRGQIEELTQRARLRDEDRAARELFTTVAEFFTDLANGGTGRLAGGGFGAAGLDGALEDITTRYGPITLALPDRLAATIVIAATAGFDAIYRCLAALHDSGVDRTAEIVLLDDGGRDGTAALIPAVVRNLRYVRLHDASGLIAGRNEIAHASHAPLIAFLAPQARVLAGWLDEIESTFAREPEAAIVGGRLARQDGLIQHAFLLAGHDGRLRDPSHLAPFDAPDHQFMREADALSGQSFAIRRETLLGLGGFSPLFTRFGHATADVCAQLREAGASILYQPLAVAAWPSLDDSDSDGEPPDLALPDEETRRLVARLRELRAPATRFVGHALVVDDDLPRPDRDAGSIATFEQLVVLRRLGWHVTFCPAHALKLDPTATELLARNGIEVVGPPTYGSVTQYLQAFGPDLGVVHIYRFANVSMLLDRVRELAPDARVIFATADLHFLREERRAALSGKTLPTSAREEELRCMLATDMTILTNDHELALLRRDLPAEKLVLLRWIERPRPIARGFAERRDICFIGNYQHPPNLDGVEWFLAEVFPLVRRKLPGIRLKLAGSGMPNALRDYEDEGVEILGWVEDLADLFGAVRLSVAPLRFGAGFKGKVATSLAYGLPVVGSTISLEGTGLGNGDGVLVADSPAAFAASVVRLHEDENLWRSQAARGPERVAALYSPEAALEIWRRMLTRLDRPSLPQAPGFST
jgi:glycosyltransferase involved in cell wall biosynthesis